jgi:hypothetical protein
MDRVWTVSEQFVRSILTVSGYFKGNSLTVCGNYMGSIITISWHNNKKFLNSIWPLYVQQYPNSVWPLYVLYPNSVRPLYYISSIQTIYKYSPDSIQKPVLGTDQTFCVAISFTQPRTICPIAPQGCGKQCCWTFWVAISLTDMLNQF